MRRFYIILIALFLFVGCNNQNAQQKADYEQTKQMIVDVLQTDEGKKALQEVISDEKMKQHLVMDAEVVKQTIRDTLLSEQATDMWQRLFEDPEFVKTFQNAIAEEQKKLLKALMYDAEFQKQFIELLQDPEMTKQTLIVLKSQEFRSHLEETIQQSLENPLFLEKIQKTLLKAAEKQNKKAGGETGSESETGNEEQS